MGFLDKLKSVVVKGEDKSAPKAAKAPEYKASAPVKPAQQKPAGSNVKPAENHGNSWSEGEEKHLRSEYDKGASIEKLSRMHGRTCEAISHRLIKLGYTGIVTAERHR
jgi:hypothetical protein